MKDIRHSVRDKENACFITANNYHEAISSLQMRERERCNHINESIKLNKNLLQQPIVLVLHLLENQACNQSYNEGHLKNVDYNNI